MTTIPTNPPDTITAQLAEGTNFKRLVTLLRLVDGAWALALYEDTSIQRQMIEKLRAALAPQSMLTISLAGQTLDLLALVQAQPLQPDIPAPVICFTRLDNPIREKTLPGYLDLQRDQLAQLPHRLILWVRESELRALAEHAPNFYSRISGIFRFPGITANPGHIFEPRSLPLQRNDMPSTSLTRRRRERLRVRDDAERERKAAQLRGRIEQLQKLARPDPQAIGDTWYDLGGLYDNADVAPYRWAEAEVAYSEAARWYATANRGRAQAEALLLAGKAAYRAYALDAALERLRRAIELYRLLEDQPGQADALLAIGAVQQFRADHDAALASYTQALTFYGQVEDRLGEANVLRRIGAVQQFRDDHDAALASYTQALTLYRQVDSRLGEANVLAAQGQLALVQEQQEDADLLLEQALEIYRAIDARYNVAVGIGNYGWVLRRVGRSTQARSYHLRAAELFAEMGLSDDAERHWRSAETE
jgi:tetratricopeptide (TPR) repeat protein